MNATLLSSLPMAGDFLPWIPEELSRIGSGKRMFF
jgi:hypothetical protein